MTQFNNLKKSHDENSEVAPESLGINSSFLSLMQYEEKRSANSNIQNEDEHHKRVALN